jgi:hypothetical protein
MLANEEYTEIVYTDTNVCENNNNKKYKKRWVFMVIILIILIWGFIRSLKMKSSNTTHYLRASQYNETKENIKIFTDHPNFENTNKMYCSGFYCFESPRKIVCSQMNSDSVPESDNNAVWECNASLRNGFNLGDIKVRCEENKKDPRNGCTLNYRINGPVSGDNIDPKIFGICICIVVLICIIPSVDISQENYERNRARANHNSNRNILDRSNNFSSSDAQDCATCCIGIVAICAICGGKHNSSSIG